MFRTASQGGLLLWAGKGRTLHADYLAVAVVQGYPQLSFNLGSQRGLLTIQSKVSPRIEYEPVFRLIPVSVVAED